MLSSAGPVCTEVGFPTVGCADLAWHQNGQPFQGSGGKDFSSTPGCVQETETFKPELLGPEEVFPSVVPFLPPLTEKTIQQYLTFYFAAVTLLIVFGGLLAPMAEVRLGIGGAICPTHRLTVTSLLIMHLITRCVLKRKPDAQ